MAAAARTPWWAWAWPVLAWVVLLITTIAGASGVIAAAAGAALIAAVFAAVYHAEVVAHRVGAGPLLAVRRAVHTLLAAFALATVGISTPI